MLFSPISLGQGRVVVVKVGDEYIDVTLELGLKKRKTAQNQKKYQFVF